MKYKGYSAHVQYDGSIEAFHGRIAGIEDIITFEGRSVAELKRAFKLAVDDYLAWCAEEGREPDKAAPGRLLLRLGPELHRQVVSRAQARGTSTNEYIRQTLEAATREDR